MKNGESKEKKGEGERGKRRKGCEGWREQGKGRREGARKRNEEKVDTERGKGWGREGKGERRRRWEGG